MTSLANRVLGQGLASLHQRSITEAPAEEKNVFFVQSKVEQFLCYCVVVLLVFLSSLDVAFYCTAGFG